MSNTKILDFSNIISINDIRRKKGLDMVDTYTNLMIEEKKAINNVISNFDILYDKFVNDIKNVKNDEKIAILFTNIIEEYTKTFDKLYDIRAKEVLKKVLLKDKIDYAIKNTGRKERPFLMYMTYRMFGGTNPSELVNFMLSIELSYGAFLVHDELLSINKSECKNKKESVCKKYGEDMALLIGDAMLNLSAEIVIDETLLMTLDYKDIAHNIFDKYYNGEDEIFDEADANAIMDLFKDIFKRQTSITTIRGASGARGFLYGKELEMVFKEKECKDIDDMIEMHAYKIGALFDASMAAGHYMSGSYVNAYHQLNTIANIMGSVYQVVDDINNMDFDDKANKKSKNKKNDYSKQTYVSIRGLEGSVQDLKTMEQCISDEVESAKKDGVDLSLLKKFVKYVIYK